MAASILKVVPILLLLFSLFLSEICALDSSSTNSRLNPQNLSSIRSFCRPTPYPNACFDSLKLSISINISPNIFSYLLQNLQTAISEVEKLSNLFSSSNGRSIVEKQRGAIQDCKELHQITLSSLHKSVSRIHAGGGGTSSRNLVDARAFLSAALTNKNTCLEGLDSASGPSKPVLVNSITTTYEHIHNSLSILSRQGSGRPNSSNHSRRRRLLGLPKWVSRKHGRILSGNGASEYDAGLMLTVAADGTGNFTTVTDAIKFAPSNGFVRRTYIYIRRGVYEENVEIPSNKPNIVLFGDGSDLTIITGNRSAASGWTTFRSATVAVSGEGFLARDVTFKNTAGAANHQAVALRVNADLVAIYRCTIDGYQDTLYPHTFRQFYRECNIYGTIDFIFGNAAVVLQACNIAVKAPLPGQFTVVTAQARDTEDENTGISIHNCSIVAAEDLGETKSYLGRPWRAYSRTVYMESYIGGFIDSAGWIEWDNEDGMVLETLYYGEYKNDGPGSGTDKRVDWAGFHVMEYAEAANFTVSELIAGDEWLASTSIPYDNGI